MRRGPPAIQRGAQCLGVSVGLGSRGKTTLYYIQKNHRHPVKQREAKRREGKESEMQERRKKKEKAAPGAAANQTKRVKTRRDGGASMNDGKTK